MPELVYTKGNMPKPGQFRADLEHATAMANPVEDLLMLFKHLYDYETKYDMASDEFYRQYQAGLLDDELQHSMTWVGLYEMFVETKRSLESALIRLAIKPISQHLPEPGGELTLDPITT